MTSVTTLSNLFQVGDEALFDFADAMPEPAHIKDVHNGRYIFSNNSNLQVYNLKHVDDLLGKTVHDLDRFMRPYWGDDFAQQIAYLDHLVSNKQTTQSLQNRIFLDQYGLINVQNMTKMPILGHTNQPQAILTLSFDLTHKTDGMYLLALYKKHYFKKSDAIYYFCKHLNIVDFFTSQLTEKEVLCLLYMKQYQCQKHVAHAMNVSLKTVETHVGHILAKSKRYNMTDILVFLRGQHIT